MTEAETDTGVIRKIQALIDKANSSEFPEEAEAFREKADDLMVKYAVEQYQLDEAARARGEKPTSMPETFEFSFEYHWDWNQHLSHLLNVVVYITGGRLINKGIKYQETEDGDRKHFTHFLMVGYHAEIQYAQMLFLSLQLHMLQALDPKADPNKSLEENIYILHTAGFAWKDVMDKLNNCDSRYNKGWAAASQRERFTTQKRDLDFIWRRYCSWCKAIGEKPTGITYPESFRRSFADSFISRVHKRISDQRNADAGTALVLRSREEKVEDLWRSLLPPPPEQTDTKNRRVARYVPPRQDPAGLAAGRAAADRADLSRPGSHVGGSRRGIES